MVNTIQGHKEIRLSKIKATLEKAKREGIEIDKEKLISLVIIEFLISRNKAKEEVEAMMNYLNNSPL